MKLRFLSVPALVFLIALNSRGQMMPENALTLLPSPPGNICSFDSTSRSWFESTCDSATKRIDAELAQRRSRMEQEAVRNEGKMARYAMESTGVSPEITQQLLALQQQKKNAHSKAERDAIDARMKALTSQMMQQTTSISMDEVDNLKKMDKAGKEAWASAYATEKQAEVMADPEAYQKTNETNMQLYKLVKEKQKLQDSLNACNQKFFKQFQDIENDSTAAHILKEIKEKRDELNKLYQEGGNNHKQIVDIQNLIVTYEEHYCNSLTPTYLQVLKAYLIFTQSALGEFYRLEQLTNQVNQLQTGTNMRIEKGELGLEQVNGYLKMLSAVYRYNIIEPRPEDIGAE